MRLPCFRWHWRAFLIGGGSAFWLLAYGIVYWALRLSLDSMTSVVLYMGYLLLLALFDFLITGAFSTPSSHQASTLQVVTTPIARTIRGAWSLAVVVVAAYCDECGLMCVHLAGTIGFLATYWAVRRLYSAIRVD